MFNQPCCFKGCVHEALFPSSKCSFHRNRAQCLVEDCGNQVYARHLCVRHGGKKTCAFSDCFSHARIGNYCVRHSKDATKQQCSEDGCTKTAHRNQKCVGHGGGRPCLIAGCSTHARAGGMCWRHRNIVIPMYSENVTKSTKDAEFLAILEGWMESTENESEDDSLDDDVDALLADFLQRAYNIGHGLISAKYLMVHRISLDIYHLTMSCIFNGCLNLAIPGTEKCEFHRGRTKCLVEGCANQVYARQLCIRHGGKKLCQAAGCLSNARSGEFCCRHGADNTKQTCKEPGCHRIAHLRQKCVRHGGGRPCKAEGCTTHARIGGYCWRHRIPNTQPSSAPTTSSKFDWIDELQDLTQSDYD
ncbi:hypothetical protein THRCLA_00272 [Thraustotheca clavata]|uniref:WRKY transcription factor 19 n=1 Tax=Thraustotheca clavata TaxID=74557 RepID=A0A1W0ABZ5_9STRA|nr:hypothetical protein THRCLA_00272 [Thraustotheca clavata]